MAFSLESALCVPIALTVIVISVRSVLPVYIDTAAICTLSAAAAYREKYECEYSSIYNISVIGNEQFITNSLKTSPDGLISIYGLVSDLIENVSGLTGGESP